ncbi:hypothetical protein CONPUDRAFT_162108 [Coniophora puteana RWD-64-598 SS2]|uniref:Uncharacterized protein n=1 Tax=Coniophora puteana (strain RWD-64-598) TaxID=741705 RepID=A0A5M3N0I7_CONPW|nr:uncharacterized protein CONPUDRAFT_162108 [Coniophora puteana RWD-64-598 SS2]EIW84757.1 hypothetical protein CONPUDRAFT_162108 [Coniophora puteana RWD-64-598 SS2]
MIAVARQEWSQSAPDRNFARVHALWGLCDLMRMGNASERREVLQSMLQEGIVNLRLELLRHLLCVMQQTAFKVIRSLSTKSFLGEYVTPATVAEITEAVSVCIYTGPDRIVNQVLDPETTWQSPMLLERPTTPYTSQMGTENCVKDCTRSHSMCQESVAWIMHGILRTSPPQPPEFCFEILRKRPRILDNLFDCAILERPAMYPETLIAQIACETLALLFRWPDHVVPDVNGPSDKGFIVHSWKAMSQALTILTSRPDWVDMIIEVWMHDQEEDMQRVRRQWDNMFVDHRPMVTQKDRDFNLLLKKREIVRLCLLRVITTLTHAADVCSISNSQIESFLHIAYSGCLKVGGTVLDGDPSVVIEDPQELFRQPEWTVLTNADFESPLYIAPEYVLGPTALVRLYSVLAQRGALDDIQVLQKPPNGLSSFTSLRHIQQITHPNIIRRVISISQLCVEMRLDQGRQRFAAIENNSVEIRDACAMFMSAAELAAALIAFDTSLVSNDKSKGKIH